MECFEKTACKEEEAVAWNRVRNVRKIRSLYLRSRRSQSVERGIDRAQSATSAGGMHRDAFSRRSLLTAFSLHDASDARIAFLTFRLSLIYLRSLGRVQMIIAPRQRDVCPTPRGATLSFCERADDVRGAL